MPNLAAVVLCGGESRRMGRPKAWLDFGGETLLERVVRLASEVAEPIVVVAAFEQDLPPLPASIVLARDAAPRRGPLEGLLAGLIALPDDVEFAYVTATDAPFLNPAWITVLSKTIGDADLAIPFVDGRYHPLGALYRARRVRPLVEQLLAANRLKLQELMAVAKTRKIERAELAAVDPDCGTLRNINSPEDYEQALRYAGIVPNY